MEETTAVVSPSPSPDAASESPVEPVEEEVLVEEVSIDGMCGVY